MYMFTIFTPDDIYSKYTDSTRVMCTAAEMFVIQYRRPLAQMAYPDLR